MLLSHRLRRRRPRDLHSLNPQQFLPPRGTALERVVVNGDAVLMWVFSSELSDDAAKCPQLEISRDGIVYYPPDEVWVEPPNGISAQYTVPFEPGPGTHCRIRQKPNAVEFVDGELVLPQVAVVA